MKVSLIRNYKKQGTGNTVFVYSVTGTQAELDAYKSAQGDNYVEDTETGAPLWFTTRCIGATGSLIITSKNKVVPNMSAFEQAASLAAQFGGNFGQELARSAAAQLLGSMAILNNTSTPAPQVDDNKDLGSFK